MGKDIFTRLLASFDEIELCIRDTKLALQTRNNVPEYVVDRVSQYSSVVDKQRQLAQSLSEQVEKQNWSEVHRLVRIINMLSVMVKDDAEAVLNNRPGAEQSVIAGALLN